MLELTRDHDLDEAWAIAIEEAEVEHERLRQLPVSDPRTKAAVVRSYERAQNNACAICGVSSSEKRLVLDHDNKHGPRWCSLCVRGLLCSRCNSALGMFLDDVGMLARAIDYLQNARVGP
jgi:hypothetical protein